MMRRAAIGIVAQVAALLSVTKLPLTEPEIVLITHRPAWLIRAVLTQGMAQHLFDIQSVDQAGQVLGYTLHGDKRAEAVGLLATAGLARLAGRVRP